MKKLLMTAVLAASAFALFVAASRTDVAAAERSTPLRGIWCGADYITFQYLDPNYPWPVTLTLRKRDIVRIEFRPDWRYMIVGQVNAGGDREYVRYPFDRGLMYDFVVECLD